MSGHHHDSFLAWDAAMTDLTETAEKLRVAVKAAAKPDSQPRVDDLVNDLSEKKRRAMDAWVAYTDASGFGRI